MRVANKPVIFDPLAVSEIRSARRWYRKRSVDAAKLFGVKLDFAIARMIERPESFPDFMNGTKRVLFDRFPYMLVFVEYQDHIYVYAVADCRREPGYWRERLKQDRD
jgi:hypothetical protein